MEAGPTGEAGPAVSPEDAIAQARDLYEMRWSETGDIHTIIITKDEIAWVLSAPAHPAEIVDVILDSETDHLPDGPWDSVAAIGTAYIELHDDLDEALGRGGNLQADPSPDTWHGVSAMAITNEGLISVAWKSQIYGDTQRIEMDPMSIMDCAHGRTGDALRKLGIVGMVLGPIS